MRRVEKERLFFRLRFERCLLRGAFDGGGGFVPVVVELREHELFVGPGGAVGFEFDFLGEALAFAVLFDPGFGLLGEALCSKDGLGGFGAEQLLCKAKGFSDFSINEGSCCEFTGCCLGLLMQTKYLCCFGLSLETKDFRILSCLFVLLASKFIRSTLLLPAQYILFISLPLQPAASSPRIRPTPRREPGSRERKPPLGVQLSAVQSAMSVDILRRVLSASQHVS